ncbi:hypothetical protein BRD10_02580 [Halobacteriales archaeon SW_12_71_31]|nr:MAG: hypothetical protein BRD10_02580 [Halobacteriales archaeon SW_12_71_31]
MGLLDWLVDRLRGSRGAPAVDPGPPGGSRDPEDPPRDHPSKQAHGSHWDAVVGDEGREAAIRRLAARAVEDGDPVEGVPPSLDGAEVTGHRLAEGPLGVVTVTLDGEVATAYPVGAGVEQAMTVTGRREWTSGLEAWLTGEVGDVAVTAFGTDYYARPGERFEGGHTVSLAGFLYDLGPAAAATVDAGGRELAVDDSFAGFTPWEAGAIDDYVVRTTPERVERVGLFDHALYRIEAPLYREPDRGTADAVFYAGTHLGDDYEPTAGEPIRAPAWLQVRVG